MTAFQPEFDLQTAAVRVRFGAGTRHAVGEEVRRLGASRALILSTPGQAGAARVIADALGDLAAGRFAGAVMHTPVPVTEEATAHARQLGADCLIAIGGGSTIGLGKAIAYRTDLPQIAVPTTYAGSEATPILGQTESGRKTTLTDPRVQPEVIVYDPELVAGLPVPITVASALNAIAHAAEALYARDRNPLATVLATEGMRAFARALPAVIASPGDLDARGQTLYGAWLCGTILGQVGMSLHHKLCHTLGGSFQLPHAETHAIILPHAVAYNAAAVPDLLAPVTEVFGGETPGMALFDFARSVGAPGALKDIGFSRADLARAADLAVANPYWNPVTVNRDGLLRLLENACEGDPPDG